MARNRATGRGRRGAIRGRIQFRLPSGYYAKVDRATGRVLSTKADRKPYKGVVIVATPERLPRRAGERRNLPALPVRAGLRSRRPMASLTELPVVALHAVEQEQVIAA